MSYRDPAGESFRIRVLAGVAVQEKVGRLLRDSGFVPDVLSGSEELLELFRAEVDEAATIEIAGQVLALVSGLLSKQARVASGESTVLPPLLTRPKWVAEQAINLLDALRERLGPIGTDESQALLGQAEDLYGTVLSQAGRVRGALSAWQRAAELGELKWPRRFNK